MLYHGPKRSGRYGLLIDGKVVKIRYASEPDEKNPRSQKIHFIDQDKQLVWSYAYQFKKYSDSKRELKLYYKSLYPSRRY